jgi:hypothetical protein
MKMYFLIFCTILAISLLFTGLLYLLSRGCVAAGLAIEHLHPPVFSFFSTIYAFFLGFAIVTLWSDCVAVNADAFKFIHARMLALQGRGS